MGRSNNQERVGRRTVSIVVDGETEMWYLQMLQRTEKIPAFTLKPDLPQARKLRDQFEEVKKNATLYDQSIWIIDLDVVIKEHATKQFSEYINNVSSNKNIHILINTPCLEFWFYQHFVDSSKYFQNYASLEKELKKLPVLKDYAKTKKYFVDGSTNIYQRLKPYLTTGLIHAQRRGSFDTDHPYTGIAEIHKLFTILGIDEAAKH